MCPGRQNKQTNKQPTPRIKQKQKKTQPTNQKQKNQTNLTLHMGKHPPPEESMSSHGQKDFHISTHRRLVSQRRAKNTPQVFEGPGPEEIMGLSAWEKLSSQ